MSTYMYTFPIGYLKTDGTVIFGRFLSAGVVVEHGVGETETALGAMEEVGAPAHPTKTTPITVELSLVYVVIETTDFTEVSGKL